MRRSRYNTDANALLLVSVLLYCTEALADDFTGRIVSILDGDTLEALHNQRGADSKVDSCTRACLTPRMASLMIHEGYGKGITARRWFSPSPIHKCC